MKGIYIKMATLTNLCDVLLQHLVWREMVGDWSQSRLHYLFRPCPMHSTVVLWYPQNLFTSAWIEGVWTAQCHQHMMVLEILRTQPLICELLICRMGRLQYPVLVSSGRVLASISFTFCERIIDNKLDFFLLFSLCEGSQL